MLEESKQDKTDLGWSDHFKGSIVLLLILFNQDNKITPATELLQMNLARLNFNEKSTKSFPERFFIGNKSWSNLMTFI